MTTSLRGSVAIVGMGETEVGALPGQGSTELCAEAARRALVDAGLEKNQLDGLITCNPWVEPHLYHAEMFSEYMQIFPRFCMTLNAGGATTLTAVQRAASAIVTGVCDTVLITHGDNPRTGMTCRNWREDDHHNEPAIRVALRRATHQWLRHGRTRPHARVWHYLRAARSGCGLCTGACKS